MNYSLDYSAFGSQEIYSCVPEGDWHDIANDLCDNDKDGRNVDWKYGKDKSVILPQKSQIYPCHLTPTKWSLDSAPESGSRSFIQFIALILSPLCRFWFRTA